MTLRLESAAMEQLATILGEASINNRKLQAQKDPATLGLLSPMDALDSSAEPGLGRNRACDASKKVYH